jgi:hypothetical protein
VIRRVIAIDFEYGVDPVRPRCMVARDLASSQTWAVWEDDLLRLRRPPFPIDHETVMVAYHIPAELSCFRALQWERPRHWIDLCAEFKLITCGHQTHHGLLDALLWFGLPAMEAETKLEMQTLALRGSPWQVGEPEALLAYCTVDVDALALLFPCFQRVLGWPPIVSTHASPTDR